MQIDQVLMRFYEGLDTPVSLSCWLLYKYGEHAQLAKKQADPMDYADGNRFQKDYAAVKYLSKYKGLRANIDTKAVALSTWEGVESKMAMVNTRLMLGQLRGFSPRVEAVLFTAQRKIASLLGECPIGAILESCRWGPGSTFSLAGGDATLDKKIGEFPMSVTRRALPYIKLVIESDHRWMECILGQDLTGPASLLPCCFNVVEGCKLTTVDKDAKTDRVIAIEPTGNIFLQLGAGHIMRKRLRRRGVDLDSQVRNQNLALEGSVNNSLATVDLSSASDSVSREAVFQLLPLDWASLLDVLRSPKARLRGQWLELEKFSSMGNGFTFELETLIFWGVASAVLEVTGESGEVAVYGDDIILPSTCYPQLLEVLEILGFSINTEKTFGSGHFRESCGKHYWSGRDVTPCYQKEVVTDLAEAYRFINRLLSLSLRLGGGLGFSSALKPAWDTAIKAVPWTIAHFVPWGDESDDGLKLPLGELLAVVTDYDHTGDRLKLPVLSFRPKHKKLLCHRSLLAYWLRFWPDEPFNGRVSLRRRGRYEPRRRWFYTYAHNDLSTLDVCWIS